MRLSNGNAHVGAKTFWKLISNIFRAEGSTTLDDTVELFWKGNWYSESIITVSVKTHSNATFQFKATSCQMCFVFYAIWRPTFCVITAILNMHSYTRSFVMITLQSKPVSWSTAKQQVWQHKTYYWLVQPEEGKLCVCPAAFSFTKLSSTSSSLFLAPSINVLWL